MSTTKKDVARMYKQKQVESATPVQLVVMLYNAAIEHLEVAERALESNKPEDKEVFHKRMVIAQNIVTELVLGLDMERGGDIADKLFKLYDYINYRLVSANLSTNKEISLKGIIEVKNLLDTVRSGWLELVRKEKVSSATNKAPEPAKRVLDLQG